MSAYDITEFLRTAYRPFAYCVPSTPPWILRTKMWGFTLRFRSTVRYKVLSKSCSSKLSCSTDTLKAHARETLVCAWNIDIYEPILHLSYYHKHHPIRLVWKNRNWNVYYVLPLIYMSNHNLYANVCSHILISTDIYSSSWPLERQLSHTYLYYIMINYCACLHTYREHVRKICNSDVLSLYAIERFNLSTSTQTYAHTHRKMIQIRRSFAVGPYGIFNHRSNSLDNVPIIEIIGDALTLPSLLRRTT